MPDSPARSGENTTQKYDNEIIRPWPPPLPLGDVHRETCISGCLSLCIFVNLLVCQLGVGGTRHCGNFLRWSPNMNGIKEWTPDLNFLFICDSIGVYRRATDVLVMLLLRLTRTCPSSPCILKQKIGVRFHILSATLTLQFT
jgi:hypothetical protein